MRLLPKLLERYIKVFLQSLDDFFKFIVHKIHPVIAPPHRPAFGAGNYGGVARR
jgi:hypothetical protein